MSTKVFNYITKRLVLFLLHKVINCFLITSLKNLPTKSLPFQIFLLYHVHAIKQNRIFPIFWKNFNMSCPKILQDGQRENRAVRLVCSSSHRRCHSGSVTVKLASGVLLLSFSGRVCSHANFHKSSHIVLLFTYSAFIVELTSRSALTKC